MEEDSVTVAESGTGRIRALSVWQVTMILAVLAISAGLVVGEVEVSTMDRGKIQGELEGLDQKTCVVRVNGTRQEIQNSEIILLKQSLPQREARPNQSYVQLLNGDFLRGNFLGGDASKFGWESSSLNKLELKVDSLRKIVFPKQAGTEDWSQFQTTEGKDRIYRKVANAVDFIDGSFEGFEQGKIVFRSRLGVEKAPVEEVAALVLTPLETPEESKDLLAVCELVDGSRFTVKLLGVQAGRLQVESVDLGKVSIEMSELEKIRFRNGSFRYLSELEPSKVEESSPFGGSDTVLFHYRKDLNVSGKPLRVGGVEYSRGLGVHSKTVLSYALGKNYRIFRAAAGIDDEVLSLAAKGSVVFRVAVDGKVVFESGVVRGGMDPVKTPDIDLKGAQELRLEVDYADDLHVADRANWLEPILIQ